MDKDTIFQEYKDKLPNYDRARENIKEALINKKIVKFYYYNSKSEKSLRKAEPLKIWFKERAWYLFAYCHEKKDIRLLKKMIVQILICISIYLVIYFINNSEYVFSKDFINKINEILSYDVNFMDLYNTIKDQYNKILAYIVKIEL